MRRCLLAGGCISPVKAVFGGAFGASGGVAVDVGSVNWLKVSSAAFVECSSDLQWCDHIKPGSSGRPCQHIAHHSDG